MRTLASLLLTLLLAACSIHKVRTVTVTVQPDRVTVDRPPYMAVGDSLSVLVRDERYANRYVATSSESALIGLERAPLFGATDLKQIQVAFGANRTPADAGPPLRPSGAEAGDEVGGPRTALDDAREAEFELEAVSLRFRARLDSLRTAVTNDPDEMARLRLLVDDAWIPVAEAVITDPAPDRTAEMLKDLAAGRKSSIDPPALETTRRDAERYARRLRALQALLPAEPPAGEEGESAVRGLMERRGRTTWPSTGGGSAKRTRGGRTCAAREGPYRRASGSPGSPRPRACPGSRFAHGSRIPIGWRPTSTTSKRRSRA